MKLIEANRTHHYSELVVEEKFLWFKWRTTYRKYKHVIFRYVEPNNFYEVGTITYGKINALFNIIK